METDGFFVPKILSSFSMNIYLLWGVRSTGLCLNDSCNPDSLPMAKS